MINKYILNLLMASIMSVCVTFSVGLYYLINYNLTINFNHIDIILITVFNTMLLFITINYLGFHNEYLDTKNRR